MGSEGRIAAVVIGGGMAAAALFFLIFLAPFLGVFGAGGLTTGGWIFIGLLVAALIIGAILFIWGVIGLVRS